MPYYRFTFFHGQAGMGGSESFVSRGVWSPDSLVNRVNSFLQLRSKIMYDVQYIAGIRVSDLGADPLTEPVKRKSIFFKPGKWWFPGSSKDAEGKAVTPLDIQQRGQRPALFAGNDWPDQFRAALHIRISLANGVSTTRYLNGFPDKVSITEAGVLSLAGDPQFEKDLNAWLGELVTYWSVMGRTTNAEDRITQVTGVKNEAALPSRLGLIMPKQPEPGLLKGDKIQVTGFRFMRDVRMTMNHTWRIYSRDTGASGDTDQTLWLANSQMIDANKIKIWGTVQRIRVKPTAITGARPYSVGIRKRGKDSTAPRGRRLTRLLADP